MVFRNWSLKPLQVAVAILAIGASFQASSKELPASAKTEIQTLLNTLATSGCEFYRNGAWHESSKAKAHIEAKLAYLEKKELVGSTEEFIELGATKSSKSGEAYQVRCPGQSPEPSAAWLGRQLKKVRGALKK